MPLPNITLRQLFESGVHFGHRTRHWNPKMSPFIFGVRQKLHIIDLEQTLPLFNEALSAIEQVVANRGKVLFVGTKCAAADSIKEQAARCNMPYVHKRWLGGMLTNYKTIRKSIKRLCNLEDKLKSDYLEKISKKEGLSLLREKEKLEDSFSGIKEMGGLPDLLFIVDVGVEKIALQEAVKLGIPIVAIVDTNNSPDHVNYVIPGNDDSRRAIAFYTQIVADVIVQAQEKVVVEEPEEKAEAVSKAKRVITSRKKVVAEKAGATAASSSDEKPAAKSKSNSKSEVSESVSKPAAVDAEPSNDVEAKKETEVVSKKNEEEGKA